jgi:small-conductance mechanosensitive channel
MTGALRALALILSLTAGAALAQDPAPVPDPPSPAEQAPAETAPVDIGGAPKTTTATGTAPTRTIRIIKTPTLDYAAWDAVAIRAEEATADDATTADALETLRVEVVDWREKLLAGQNVNATRIGALRTQLTALGPAPAAGETEADEIASRRSELNDQLVTLEAPVVAAEAAYSRANALVGEIDRALRERQADELLKLWPMPANPANWPAGLGALRDVAVTLYDETARAVRWPSNRVTFANNLPLIMLYLALAVGLLWRGRDWIDRLVMRLQARAAARTHRLWETIASFGQVVVPMLGVVALSEAMQLSGMVGVLGRDLTQALPAIAAPVFVAVWLGGRLFPHGEAMESVLLLPGERRAEGRFLASSFGLVLAVEAFRGISLNRLGSSEAAIAVLSFPILVVAGVLLMRMGRLLRRYTSVETGEPATPTYRLRVLTLIGRAAIVIGLLAPVLAAVGYVSAAGALVYPAILSLGLVGGLFLLQQLVSDIYSAVARDDDAGQQALIPVLVGFALTLAMLPLLALVWGARVSDLTELWTRFREGFRLGNTQISPTDFLVFAVVFAIGYTLTRLFQGALKSTILPKTSLDRGGQNAIAVGVGYLGIFVAALIAINAAGLDLSGLAIVAGALSVGIGFGLQTIVSNFVSGIILLIERPISEGDWIEVGTVQGIVKAISVRSTRIQTFDRNDVIVPNSDLITGRVTNWTRFNLTGRLIVPVAVPFMTDSRQVETILREIAEAQPMALLNPAPIIAFMGFGAETMNFEMRVILRDVNFLVPVRSEINHAIAQRFAAAGIDFSIAHREQRAKAADEARLHAAEAGLGPLMPPQTPKDMPT